MSVTIVLPAVSRDRISADLRELTALINEVAPDRVARGLLGGDNGYGAEFENDVFVMHPYYWGDCECGHAEKAWEWENSHSHAAECYQSLIDWDAPREVKDAQVTRVCLEMGLDPVYGSYVHCTCTYQAEWGAWLADNQHDSECGVVQPNFRHKDTGFEVRWYKYIGRGMEHDEISRGEWRRIFRECEDSLEGR